MVDHGFYGQAYGRLAKRWIARLVAAKRTGRLTVAHRSGWLAVRLTIGRDSQPCTQKVQKVL